MDTCGMRHAPYHQARVLQRSELGDIDRFELSTERGRYMERQASFADAGRARQSYHPVGLDSVPRVARDVLAADKAGQRQRNGRLRYRHDTAPTAQPHHGRLQRGELVLAETGPPGA